MQGTTVSATLGQDTVRNSLIAGVVGLVVVVLFMVGYYRFPGVLASRGAAASTRRSCWRFYKLIPVT